MKTQWIKYRSGNHARKIKSAPPYRPTLEVMEDRQVPAVLAYQAMNLVSDQPGQAATVDPLLINAWGIAIAPSGGNIWVAAKGTDLAQVYARNAANTAVTRVNSVRIPGDGPTSIAFTGSKSFLISDANGRRIPASFFFATESGVISAWSPALSTATRGKAQPIASLETSSFTGLTVANNGEGEFLYGTDFRNNTIQVFDSSFSQPMNAGPRAVFVDPSLPEGYSPFNIQNLGDTLYVTYALQNVDGTGDVPGAGHGIVNAFDARGQFLHRVATQGVLNSPWGLALSPANFGAFSNALLVGNSGDGMINAFEPKSGAFLGTLSINENRPLVISGLHGIAFGTGASNSQTLYFAAGPDNGLHGLLGQITPTNNFTDQVNVELVSMTATRGFAVGTIRVQNLGGAITKPITLFLSQLPAGVKVANPAGINADGYFITLKPMAGNRTQDMKIRFMTAANQVASLKDFSQIQFELLSTSVAVKR